MSCKPESTIWSCDTGQWIPCFDRCQLVIAWMSKINISKKYTVRAGSHFDISISTSINISIRKIRKIHVNRGYISINVSISISIRKWKKFHSLCLCLCLCLCLICNPGSHVFFLFFLCLCLCFCLCLCQSVNQP